MSASRTTDHRTIRSRVEERKGVPSVVRATGGRNGDSILRIEFDRSQDSLDEVSRDGSVDTFGNSRPAFLCQDDTKDGSTGRFFKMVGHDETWLVQAVAEARPGLCPGPAKGRRPLETI